MYFKRFFRTGYDGSDPRDRHVAEFICDACGHKDWVITTQPESFDKDVRRCPKCHSLGLDDHRKNLEGKRRDLEAQQLKVREEIEKVIAELDRLKTVEQPVEQPKG